MGLFVNQPQWGSEGVPWKRLRTDRMIQLFQQLQNRGLGVGEANTHLFW